jgi:integrase
MVASVKLIRGIWHYRFQIDGKRIQRSTRLRGRNRGKAMAIAQRAYDDAITLRNQGKRMPTLAELAAEWLRVRGPVVSRAHATSVEAFARLHLFDLGALRIEDITTRRVELARNDYLKTHKPASANHWLRNLKLVVNWAVADGVLPKLPWKVPMIPVQKRPRTLLPLADTVKWFAVIDEFTRRPVAQGVATAIRMMYGLGLREMEAAGARWEWVDWERGTYTPGKTKGYEAEPIDMPDWLVAHLLPLRRESGLIAPRRNGRQRPSGFTATAMRHANTACQIHGLTPHRLRGTFATLLSENGVPIQEVQAALRHKDPMTTMKYLERKRGTLKKGQQGIAELNGMMRQQNGGEPAAGAQP